MLSVFRTRSPTQPNATDLRRVRALAVGHLRIRVSHLSLMLNDFFDTARTFTALGAEAGLLDAQGHLRAHEQRAYLVDSLSALAGGLVTCA